MILPAWSGLPMSESSSASLVRVPNRIPAFYGYTWPLAETASITHALSAEG